MVRWVGIEEGIDIGSWWVDGHCLNEQDEQPRGRKLIASHSRELSSIVEYSHQSQTRLGRVACIATQDWLTSLRGHFSRPLNFKHFHYFIAQVVDHLHGNPARLWFLKRP